MEVIRKNLLDNNIEEPDGGMKFLSKTPVFLLEFLIRFKMEDFRKSMENPEQVLLTYSNNITKTSYDIYGWKENITLQIYNISNENKLKKPLFYFIHGGGFFGGSSNVNDNFMRALVDQLNCVVVNVDYHLAPESKYPEPFNDCYKGIKYLLQYADDFGIDKSNIYISGDSAGGNIAAGLTLKLTEENIPIQKQILYYPLTDLYKLNRPSHLQKGEAYQGMKKLTQVVRNLYLNNKQERRLPFVSPLRSIIPKNMPETLIMVAEHDGIRDDGIYYAKVLNEHNCKTKCVLYEGAYHAFINSLGKSPIANDSLEETINFIKT